MKSYKLLIAAVALSFGISFQGNAQTYKVNNNASTLLVDGTSNIHDWTMEAESSKGMLQAEFDENELEEISKLEFSVEAEALKSGKGGMDKNTYKALNTDKHKMITYKLKQVKEIKKTGENKYSLNTTGSLEIAGTKKDISLSFDLKKLQDKLVINGEHSLNMTDYGVEPPTAMFGTISTGDRVTIKFETHFNK